MNQNQVVTNNIVMNNYITIGNKNQRIEPKKGVPQKEVPIDDLMSYFSTNYKNILPNRLNRDFDFKTMLFPFEKGQVVELLYQMDILIQLLVQNFLFTSNEDTKFKSYELLMKIYNKKNFVCSCLDYMPTYQVPLSQFKLDNMMAQQADSDQPAYNNQCPLYFNLKPQMSVFQSPLLELTELFIEIKSKVHSKEKLKEALLYLEPFIQRNWIPSFSEQTLTQGSARTKFNYIDDCLLLIGLTKHGAKQLELIQQNYLPDKKVAEIKNRYKNLICGRASNNKIKRWKILQFAPLREEEKLKLQKAMEWFGGSLEKYHLIARYFLVDRSPEFIKGELTGSENLVKKRKKYANLLNPNFLLESSPQPTLEIQMHRHTGDETNGNVTASHTPGGMEVEQANNMHGHEQFDQLNLNFGQAEERMILEENRLSCSNFFKQANEENFESVEFEDFCEISSSDGAVTQFLQGSKVNKTLGASFKRIGSQIFEYEEICEIHL